MKHIAEIQDVKETPEGTYIKIFIPFTFIGTRIERYKNNDKAYLQIKLDDGRTITSLQRKMYYATLKDISDHVGHLTEELHDYFKISYKYKYDDIPISMSSCSIGQANQMIDLLIDFVLTNNIPLTDLCINRTTEVDRYLYLCLVRKKCACCGVPASEFQLDNKWISLCGRHKMELEIKGPGDFKKEYQVRGLELDQYTMDKLEI